MPSRFTLAALAALFGLLFAVWAAGSAQASVIVESSSVDRPLTPAQMRSAIPVDSTPAGMLPGSSATRTPRSAARASARAGLKRRYADRQGGARPVTGELEPPLSAHGRIFFQKAGSQEFYSCSGTVVRSRNRNLIFTAGHCVYDLGRAAFNEGITFVPAYRDGQAPFGQFPASFGLTTSGWIGGAGTGHDIGAIVVDSPVQDVVGGRPIDFMFNAVPGSRFLIFAYPSFPTPTYDGETPIVCEASFVPGLNTGGRSSLPAAPCDMEQGSSGGGWITPGGYLVSVVSHGYCESQPQYCGVIFGPRLGNVGAKIYQRAGGSEPPRLSIKRGPRGKISARRARFSFAIDASTQVTLECRFAGPGYFQRAKRGFRRCGRKPMFANLRPGRYVLRTRLIDQSGRRAHVRRAFTVVR